MYMQLWESVWNPKTFVIAIFKLRVVDVFQKEEKIFLSRKSCLCLHWWRFENQVKMYKHDCWLLPLPKKPKHIMMLNIFRIHDVLMNRFFGLFDDALDLFRDLIY